MPCAEGYTDRNEVLSQYCDPGNLNARSAIYRFGNADAKAWPRWVFDQLLDLSVDARVLEIGCGDGGLWKRNVERIPAGWDVTLMDLSPGMVNAGRDATGFASLRGDAEQLPFADAFFDAVIANHMLSHVPQRAGALREVRRVLNPGGKLFATTNSDNHMSAMKELIHRFMGNASPLAVPMPFTLENGEPQLREVFAIVETRRSHGALRVTEASAVVNYVMSVEGAPQHLTGARLDELHAAVNEKLAAEGAYLFATETGMFIAQRE